MRTNITNETKTSGFLLCLATTRRLPAKFIWLNALVLTAMVAGLALASLLPQGPSFHTSNLGAILIFFDGRWYQNIALHGYRWDPALGVLPGHFQNTAFFPLYPLIERLLITIPGMGSQYGLSLLSLVFGLWSNLAFSRFTLRLLPERSAFWACAFFICWPAACFLWMGYPTGLINLCAIYCLQDYIEARRFRAAIWCGVGSAIAPTMVFVAAALCLHSAFKWVMENATPREIPKLIAFGLLSVSGLLGFMVYMFIKFHDALVFIKAQKAWGTSPNFVGHLVQFFDPIRYLVVFGFVARAVDGVLHHHLLDTETGRDTVDIAFQLMLNFFTVFISIFAIYRTFRHFSHKEMSIAGLFVILGYLWFIVSTTSYFVDGIRLCFPALALFLGMGDWAAKSKNRSCALLSVFLLLLIIETALVKAGYTVI